MFSGPTKLFRLIFFLFSPFYMCTAPVWGVWGGQNKFWDHSGPFRPRGDPVMGALLRRFMTFGCLFGPFAMLKECLELALAEPHRSVDSKSHLGKWNRRSGSKVMDNRKLVFKMVFVRTSCISKAYFCISDLPSRTASICRFRKSPQKVKSEFRIKS